MRGGNKGTNVVFETPNFEDGHTSGLGKRGFGGFFRVRLIQLCSFLGLDFHIY